MAVNGCKVIKVNRFLNAEVMRPIQKRKKRELDSGD